MSSQMVLIDKIAIWDWGTLFWNEEVTKKNQKNKKHKTSTLAEIRKAKILYS